MPKSHPPQAAQEMGPLMNLNESLPASAASAATTATVESATAAVESATAAVESAATAAMNTGKG